MSNINLIIEERAANIGNFLVGRLLPFRQKRMVGPFIFIDHMGPVKMSERQNLEALENLSNETDFIQDLKINSANIVDIFLDTEEKFDIEINNDALEKIKNVGDAIQVVFEKANENSPA